MNLLDLFVFNFAQKYLSDYIEELRKNRETVDHVVDPNIIQLLALEVLRAYKEFHNSPNRTFYQDVKPQNILVNHRGPQLKVELCDFAGPMQARSVASEDEGFAWVSPEMLQRKEALIPSLHDLWGVGW